MRSSTRQECTHFESDHRLMILHATCQPFIAPAPRTAKYDVYAHIRTTASSNFWCPSKVPRNNRISLRLGKEAPLVSVGDGERRASDQGYRLTGERYRRL